MYVRLQEWELVVLQVLRWEISAVTSYDYVEQILARLRVGARHVDRVRRHSHILIAMCATGEPSFFSSSLLPVVAHARWKTILLSVAVYLLFFFFIIPIVCARFRWRKCSLRDFSCIIMTV